LVVALVWASTAAADPTEKARKDFAAGRVAYDRGDYPRALELFKAAYLISQLPEMLYNMARAQEGMRSYGEAAETLRAYLRVTTSTPDRPAIEEHIRSLEESQRLVAAGTPQDQVDAKLKLDLTAPPPDPRRRAFVIGGVAAAVIVVALAIGLGVGLGTRGPSYSAADVGPLRSTP
jgi:tetratricopeptide (TPR) repeat protein